MGWTTGLYPDGVIRPVSSHQAREISDVLPPSLGLTSRASNASRQMRWRVARLRAMPASEPAERVRQTIHARLGAVGTPAVVAHRPASKGSRLLTREHADLLRRELPQEAALLVATASRRAAGEFALLGYPPQLLARPIEWDRDKGSGRRWPRCHGLMTDYRHHPVGDPKWVWELNRLQHIPLLL